jgi:hypothetical protein
MVQFELRGIKFQTRLVIKECSVFEALLRKVAIAAYGNQSEVTFFIPYNEFSSIVIIIRSPAGRCELRPFMYACQCNTTRFFIKLVLED